MAFTPKKRLKRLSPEYYRGEAWVHWTLTVEGRKTGWLDARFLYRFRELLTHVAFRDQLACPVFCLMPDHLHLLWCGLADACDQRIAMKRFRKDINGTLGKIGYRLQGQAYDNVLRDADLDTQAIEDVMEYIARNAERKGLVSIDEFASYSYTGCLLPGCPQLRLFQDSRWGEIWRALSFLKRTECFRVADPKYINP